MGLVGVPWIRVLGPLEVARGEVPVRLSGARQRRLLAALLAARGSVVPTDILTDVLWGDEPPANPEAALHSQVARLRRSMRDVFVDGCELVTRSPGYALVASAQHVDSLRFEELVDQARAADGDVGLYDEALALWRGPAYAEFADLPGAHLEGIRLDELRAAFVEERAEVLLSLGQAERVVPELEAFVAEHPLREGARAALMRALYESGRHGDALQHYQDYRRHLGEELGLEPAASLQRLEHQILTHALPAQSTPASQPARTLETMQVRYVRRPGRPPIATAKVGSGRQIVVVPAWVTSLDVIAAGRDPRSTLVEHLVQHAGVTLYDRLGTGLSPGPVDDFSLDASTEELVSVLEHVGGGTVLGVSQAGPIAVTAAARRPDLVDSLILIGTFAGASEVFTNTSLNQALVDLTRARWAMGARLLADLYRPGASTDAGRHLAAVLRDSAESTVAAGYLEETYRVDVTPLLAQVTQPALVVHYRGDRVIPFRGGQQLAMGLPNARFVPLEGPYHLPDAADLPQLVPLITEFAGNAHARPPRSAGDR